MKKKYYKFVSKKFKKGSIVNFFDLSLLESEKKIPQLIY